MHVSDTHNLLNKLGDSDFAYRQFSSPAPKTEHRGSAPANVREGVAWPLLEELASGAGVQAHASSHLPTSSTVTDASVQGTADAESNTQLQNSFSNALSWLEEPHVVGLDPVGRSAASSPPTASQDRDELSKSDLRSHVDSAQIDSVPVAERVPFTSASSSQGTPPPTASWLQQNSPRGADLITEPAHVTQSTARSTHAASLEPSPAATPVSATQGTRLFRGYAQPEASGPARESLLRALLRRVAG